MATTKTIFPNKYAPKEIQIGAVTHHQEQCSIPIDLSMVNDMNNEVDRDATIGMLETDPSCSIVY